jgi:hypothetical protein
MSHEIASELDWRTRSASFVVESHGVGGYGVAEQRAAFHPAGIHREHHTTGTYICKKTARFVVAAVSHHG